MKKNLAMVMTAAALMALAALATLWLAGGAAATAPSSKTILIPFGAWAEASGAAFECRYGDSSTKVPSYFCYTIHLVGKDLYPNGNTYAVLVDSLGIVVEKYNAPGTKATVVKVYNNPK
jgi:hypothetical protein